MAVAARNGGAWRLDAPEPVGPPGDLLAALRRRAGGSPVAFGIDCPLGLPREFVARHPPRAADFPAFLRGLAEDAEIWRPAGDLAEVSARRPFYPARATPGITRGAHAAALGLSGPAALARLCDRATVERPAGASPFWTLGANQSGRAALAAWRDMLGPALRGPAPPLLWPFAGPFRALLRPGAVAVAETYPAEALRQLGLRPRGSKRRQADRQAQAPALRAAMDRLAVEPAPEHAAALEAGFGADAAGEDRFDCVLGVLGVIGVVAGARPDTAPADPMIARWEGWVLGQTAMPRP